MMEWCLTCRPPGGTADEIIEQFELFMFPVKERVLEGLVRAVGRIRRIKEEDKIKFEEYRDQDLGEWAKIVIKIYLGQHNIKWKIGDITIDGVICLKLEHPILHYLDIDTPNRQFMFCIENHRASISPNEASIILFRSIGIEATVLECEHGELWNFSH